MYANKTSERHASFSKNNYVTKSVYIPVDEFPKLEKFMHKTGYKSYSKFFLDAMREKMNK